MEQYSTNVQVLDSPFMETNIYEDDEYVYFYSSDSVRAVKQRMVLILALVSIVAATLGFLTLPATGQSEAGNTEIRVGVSENQPSLGVGASGQETADIVSINGKIADLFTPEVQYWESNILTWANEHGVDPNAVATIMQIESCGDPQAVSVAGARGLFQVMPFHFSSDEDMLDPDTNAMRGMNFFNEQLRYTGGDVYLSFAGYNGGYAASGGSYANWANETQRYYGWAKGIYEDAAAGLDRSETLETWLAAGGAAGCQRAADRLGLN